jgi:hypothetical protein
MSSSRLRLATPLALALLLGSGSVAAAPSIGDIVTTPARNQTAQAMRRDRFECHNWAVEQIGGVPAPATEEEATRRGERGERVAKVLTGAGIGAFVGGLVRGDEGRREANDGALGGAVVGAAVGAAIGRNRDDETDPEEEDEVFDAYFRALSACMEARGYTVTRP